MLINRKRFTAVGPCENLRFRPHKVGHKSVSIRVASRIHLFFHEVA